MVRFLITMLLVALPLAGCAARSEAFNNQAPDWNQLIKAVGRTNIAGVKATSTVSSLKEEVVSELTDQELVELVCQEFKLITEVENQALSTETTTVQKKKIFIDGLGEVCSKNLVNDYLRAWDNNQLAVTLELQKFTEAHVVNRQVRRAQVEVKVDGQVVDESGKSPVTLLYKLTVTKKDKQWLLDRIEIEK